VIAEALAARPSRLLPPLQQAARWTRRSLRPKFLQSNGVRVDEASVQSLTADIFNETALPAA